MLFAFSLVGGDYVWAIEMHGRPVIPESHGDSHVLRLVAKAMWKYAA